MKDLRISVQVRNNVLWHAIYDKYKTVGAVAEASGVGANQISSVLGLRVSPMSMQTDTPKTWCQQLALFFDIPFEVLFPMHLYRGLYKYQRDFEVHAATFLQVSEVRLIDGAPTPEDSLIENDRRERLETVTANVLSTLTPREAAVIRRRFGIGGHEEESLEDIGKSYAVTHERIRQIEAKAIRKLRHPSRKRVIGECAGISATS